MFYIIKIISTFISSLSQIGLKKSANTQHTSKINEYVNVQVIFSYFVFFLSMVLGVFSLKGMKISTSTVIESLSYVFVPLFSFLLLKEKISKKQIISIIVIFIGIIIFNL